MVGTAARLACVLFGCIAVACGGTVTPPADMAAPDGGGRDGAGATDASALVACGTAVREGVSYCCSSDYGKTGYCGAAMQQSCAMDGVPGTACDEPTDCKGAEVCCQRSAMSSSFTCVRFDQCPAERDRLCGVDEECGADAQCCPYDPSGPSFRRCTKTLCKNGDGGV